MFGSSWTILANQFVSESFVDFIDFSTENKKNALEAMKGLRIPKNIFFIFAHCFIAQENLTKVFEIQKEVIVKNQEILFLIRKL